MIVVALVVFRFVRQSRLLWLHVPGSRARVFDRVELAALRLFVRFVVAALGAGALAPLLLSATLVESAWGVCLATSAVLFAVYLALASVRGLRLLLAGLALMAVTQSVLLSNTDRPDAQLAGVVIGQLVAALILRAVARRRWPSIDWLEFRPLQWPRQFPRAG
jgi:hypothetical protein